MRGTVQFDFDEEAGMSLHCWLLLVPSLCRCVVGLCGDTNHVVSEESGDILLQVDKEGVTEVSWIFNYNLIALTKPREAVQTKAHRFKSRLYNGTNGSLNITQLTKDDQGLYVANLRLNSEQECNEIYNLTVYSKLGDDDLKIQYNITWEGTCSVTLKCTIDKNDVKVTWKNAVTSTIEALPTVEVTDPYTNYSWTCTASNPMASVSRSVIPLDFCMNEWKWEIILGVTVGIVFFLIAGVIAFWFWKKHGNICTKIPWKRKAGLRDDLQQMENVYWEIDQPQTIYRKAGSDTRTEALKINAIYVTAMHAPVKSAYNRRDFLQGDDDTEEDCY